MAVSQEQPSHLDVRWELERWMVLRLTHFGTQLSFGPGEIVLQEGGPTEGLFLILSGSVEVSRAGSRGAPGPPAVLGPFRSFGEVCLLGDRPAPATVIATAPVRCVRFTRRQLAEAEDKEPRLAGRLYRLLAESLARSVGSTRA